MHVSIHLRMCVKEKKVKDLLLHLEVIKIAVQQSYLAVDVAANGYWS